MQEILKGCASILDATDTIIFDRIASTRRERRERAIDALTKDLDTSSIIDNTIIQSLPLQIAQRGDIISAIWYLETI